METIIITSVDTLKEIVREVVNEQFNVNANLVIKSPQEGYDSDELLSFKQTLLLLKISAPTLYKRMKDRTIPYRKVGRRLLFSKNEILNCLKGKTNK